MSTGIRMSVCLDCSGQQRFVAVTYKLTAPVGHTVGTRTPYWDLHGCLPRSSSAGLEHPCAPAKGPGPGAPIHQATYHRKLSARMVVRLGCRHGRASVPFPTVKDREARRIRCPRCFSLWMCLLPLPLVFAANLTCSILSYVRLCITATRYRSPLPSDKV